MKASITYYWNSLFLSRDFSSTNCTKCIIDLNNSLLYLYILNNIRWFINLTLHIFYIKIIKINRFIIIIVTINLTNDEIKVTKGITFFYGIESISKARSVAHMSTKEYNKRITIKQQKYSALPSRKSSPFLRLLFKVVVINRTANRGEKQSSKRTRWRGACGAAHDLEYPCKLSLPLLLSVAVGLAGLRVFEGVRSREFFRGCTCAALRVSNVGHRDCGLQEKLAEPVTR